MYELDSYVWSTSGDFPNRYLLLAGKLVMRVSNLQEIGDTVSFELQCLC